MDNIKKYWHKVTRFEYEYYIKEGKKIFTGAYRQIHQTGQELIDQLRIVEGELQPV